MGSVSSAEATTRGFDLKKFVNRWGILLVLVGMAALLAVLTIDRGSSIFLRFRNIVNILRQSSVIGIIALGVTYVIITGGIDLSSGSLVAMIGVISAILAREVYGLPLIVPVAAALIIGVFAGSINGFLHAKFKIPPFIATLGMMVSARVNVASSSPAVARSIT
jgi:inositol transport system permease protein